jgi:hypothetical protein
MTTYTQGESLTDLMEKARQEDGIYIRRDDGLLFLLKPEAPRSPFDVPGVDTGLTREEILEAIHDGRNSDRW